MMKRSITMMFLMMVMAACKKEYIPLLPGDKVYMLNTKNIDGVIIQPLTVTGSYYADPESNFYNIIDNNGREFHYVERRHLRLLTGKNTK